MPFPTSHGCESGFANLLQQHTSFFVINNRFLNCLYQFHVADFLELQLQKSHLSLTTVPADDYPMPQKVLNVRPLFVPRH